MDPYPLGTLKADTAGLLTTGENVVREKYGEILLLIKRGHIYQGAGKRPRQCCPKGPKTKEKATRGPEGPESG